MSRSGRDAGRQKGAQDPRHLDSAVLGDVGHRGHLGLALRDEVACQPGQRPRAVCLDHLLEGGAALGQVLQERQALGGRGTEGVVEPDLLPQLGVHD